MKNFAGILCAVLLAFSFVMPIQTASAFDKIDPQLLAMGIQSERTEGFFVEFEKPTVVGMATFDYSMVYQSRELMRDDNFARKLYVKSVEKMQSTHINHVKEMLPDAIVGHRYQYAFNGYYINTKLSNILKIASFPEIRRVFYIPQQQLFRTRTRKIVNAEKVWATVKDAKGRPIDGTGVLVSVSDTGLDYTHQDFGSQKSPVGPKVVISRDLAMNDNDCQEEDSINSSHGTACASLIAGDGPDDPKTNVREKGIAPKALLAGYKIEKLEGKEGYLDSQAIMKSWDFIIKDKIQVSNNSWGRPGGDHQFEIQQRNCTMAGCTVVVSNGNNGSPGQTYFAIPQGSSAAANSVIGVGATDETDFSTIQISNAPDSEVIGKPIAGHWGSTGKMFTSFDIPIQAVDCLWGRKDDFEGLDVKGKIALIQRGPKEKEFGEPITFKEKIINAALAGAKGVLLYNHTPGKLMATYIDSQKNENPTDFNFVPSYELNKSQGDMIRKQLHSGHDWVTGQVDKSQNDVTVSFAKPTYRANIADFSSNGPTIQGFLKPDVCATGVNVHAAVPRPDRAKYKTNYTENFGGTSSAGPFVAGCAALITQGRPEWDPLTIKRSLMNTATLLKRTDGEYYLPLTVQGMGRVNVYDAITTQVLVQPPSGLILAQSGKINIADLPDELKNGELFEQLPNEIKSSTYPLKLYNYSNKETTLEISFEINSGRPGQFDVSATSSQISIPPAGKTPGVAWVGINIKLPNSVEGIFNDVVIWLTDKKNNRRIHTGICIYNNDPRIGGANNTYASFIKVDKPVFTPNGDGQDDQIEITYDVTNGSWNWGYYPPLWSNYGDMLAFVAMDVNQETWTTIHVEEEFELGPGRFVWDGKDENGNYILPDGDWIIGVSAINTLINSTRTALIQEKMEFGTSTSFSVESSTIPSLPTLSAHVLPLEPGVGQEFEVGLFLHNAKDVKSLQFKINMPGTSSIVQYMGYQKGEFFVKDEPLTLVDVDYDKDKELFNVNLQRPLDGVTGDGWVLKLKFMAKESNYFDVRFSDMLMSAIDDTGKEVKTKAFYKNGEISILNQAYDVSDFNRDSKIDDADLKIIMSALDSTDGDDRYNWRCDLNYDLKITTADIAIFSKSYKKR
ncbi:MAG: S8 family serine peptidase [Caldisericia bacterium]|nr:S8 family serine peptidase [Caldisericia bacterium]